MSKRLRPLLIALILLALVAGGYALLARRRGVASEDPYGEAARTRVLQQLVDASAEPAQFYVQQGFLRFVMGAIPASGDDPVAKAAGYLDAYPELYGLDYPGLALQLIGVSGAHDENVAYRQTYYDLPVFGSSLLVNLDGDRIGYVSAALTVPPIALDTTYLVEPEAALELVAGQLGVESVRPLAPPDLVVYDPSLARDVPPEQHLAWQISLPDWLFLVDAHTGALLYQSPTSLQILDGGALNGYDLDLEDANYASGGFCFTNTNDDDFIADENGFNPSYNNDGDAIFAWQYAAQTYYFYHSTFNLHGFDGDEAQLELYVHASDPTAWKPSCDIIQFQDGFVAKDVMVHEFTHGVIESNDFGGPGLYFEGGAIHESMADVFGSLADGNWVMGEFTTGGVGPFRNLADPQAFGTSPCGLPFPEEYSQYCSSTDDFGAVHANSLIISHAAYLIAQGGTQNGVTVQGLGKPALAGLYYSLLAALAPSYQFIDLRFQAVAYAHQTMSTQDACQVDNAFHAVEIGPGDQDCDGISDNADNDDDGDSIVDTEDNCVGLFNPYQQDLDHDGIGDLCDDDIDGDTVLNADDNCIDVANPRQQDADGDGKGDLCDDDDVDGVLDIEDNCVGLYNPVTVDTDLNGFPDAQNDQDGDGLGDPCDNDLDGDQVANAADNCPWVPNPLPSIVLEGTVPVQADADGDGLGDACDKCPNTPDNAQAYTSGFPEWGIPPQPLQTDSDGDGKPDACDFEVTQAEDPGHPYAVDDFGPQVDGGRQDLALDPKPGDFTQIPLPICPPDRGDWRSQVQREVVELVGLDPAVIPSIADGLGHMDARPVADQGIQFLWFQPQSSQPHYLRLSFSSDLQPGVPSTFQISLRCGPRDEVGYPLPGEADTPLELLTPEPNGEAEGAPAGAPVAIGLQDTNCRYGPASSSYDISGTLFADQQVPIEGVSADGAWLWVGHPNYEGEHCWVPLSLVRVEGDLEGLPVISAPPTETPAPIEAAPDEPTSTPTATPRATAPSSRPTATPRN